MNKQRSESLKKLKDYIDENKKECEATIMKLRDFIDMHTKNELIMDDNEDYSIEQSEDYIIEQSKDYSIEQSSLSIYYNLLNNSPDHLTIYYNKNLCHYFFFEPSSKKLSLLRSVILFSSKSNSFLLNLPTYPEINGYAWDKKIANKFCTNKYFDKDLRDRLLNRDIFVSIIS